jgi:hypothetical protein
MNSFVWHVEAPDFDVEAFLARHPLLARHAESHRQGETLRLGRKERIREGSGFTLCLEDKETFVAALSFARRTFTRFEEAALELRKRGISSVLDLGITVGTPREFVRSVRFDVDDLEFFARLGVALEVTAYPCVEDSEEESGQASGADGRDGGDA